MPFFMALYYSLSNTTTGGGTLGFVGLRNFTNVVGTPKFQTALKNTLIFALLSQAVILVLSNALALALQKDFRGKRLIRFLILLPWVAPISIGTSRLWTETTVPSTLLAASWRSAAAFVSLSSIAARFSQSVIDMMTPSSQSAST